MMYKIYAKAGTIGLVTYTSVNVTTFGTLYALIATRALDPIPVLRHSATVAARVGIDAIPQLKSLEAAWAADDGVWFGSTFVLSLALTKLLLPAKLSVTAALVPMICRLSSSLSRNATASIKR